MNDTARPRETAWDGTAARRQLVAEGFCHVPGVLGPAALQATREAADAIGRPDLGRLSPGNPADMIAVSVSGPAFGPVIPDEDDLISRLVWSGSPAAVHSSWVGGRQVVEEGRVLTVDVEAYGRDVSRRAARLAAG